MPDKTLAQKMHVKPGSRVLLLDAPQGYSDVLSGLPAGVSLGTSLAGDADVIMCFLTSLDRLRQVLPQLKAAIRPGGALWIAYAKGTSTLAGDANRDSIRSYSLMLRLEAVSLVAIDADWAALRLRVV
jgi:hypothetical protein